MFNVGDKVRLTSSIANQEVVGTVEIVWDANDVTREGNHFDYTVEFPGGEIDDFTADELTTVKE